MHPYHEQPPHSFWTKAVAQGLGSTSLVKGHLPLVAHNDIVASAGSCFASNMIPFLEAHGFSYYRAEPLIAELDGFGFDNYGYSKFSAAYGNIYTAKQFLQLVLRAKGKFRPQEDRWHVGDRVIDPFRPGMKYNARSDREFDLLQCQHLKSTKSVFEAATTFIFTFGLTESWISVVDGAVFPACPGTINGTFDPTRHAFRNFKLNEIVEDTVLAVAEIRQLNPKIKFIFTISPVPLAATASNNHVLLASMYSKAVLRVAVEEIINQIENTIYFPAYEIVTGPQAPDSFFAADRRNVTESAVKAVMDVFLSCSGEGKSYRSKAREEDKTSIGPALSALVIQSECEEGSLDKIF